MTADLDIVGLVTTDRHIGEWKVRDDRELVGQRLVVLPLQTLSILDEGLDVRDLGFQLFGPRGVTGAHRVADFLRRGVAALLLFLETAKMCPALLVGAEDPSTTAWAASDD